MAPHHGHLLKRYLAINEISVENLAKKMKKSKVTLYAWIQKPILNLVQLDELKKAGIELAPESSTLDFSKEITYKDYTGYNNYELVQIIQKKDLDIERLTDMLQQQSRTNEMLAETISKFSVGEQVKPPKSKSSSHKPHS